MSDIFDWLYGDESWPGYDPDYVANEDENDPKDPEEGEGGYPPGGTLPGVPKSEGDWGP